MDLHLGRVFFPIFQRFLSVSRISKNVRPIDKFKPFFWNDNHHSAKDRSIRFWDWSGIIVLSYLLSWLFWLENLLVKSYCGSRLSYYCQEVTFIFTLDFSSTERYVFYTLNRITKSLRIFWRGRPSNKEILRMIRSASGSGSRINFSTFPSLRDKAF